MFCSRHIFFLWPNMDLRGALKCNFSHKMMLVHLIWKFVITTYSLHLVLWVSRWEWKEKICYYLQKRGCPFPYRSIYIWLDKIRNLVLYMLVQKIEIFNVLVCFVNTLSDQLCPVLNFLWCLHVICPVMFSLLAFIALSVAQSSAQTRIHSDILVIDTSNNASYNQVHWLVRTPYLSIKASNATWNLVLKSWYFFVRIQWFLIMFEKVSES